MAKSPEVQIRIEGLANELRQAATADSRRATRAYYFSQVMLFLALGCSLAAAISGIFFSVSPKIVGGLAALPPLIAYVAAGFRLELRQNWYYRSAIALEAFRSRLLYQLPEQPTVDNISAIAQERDKLMIEMQHEWYETITKNFLDFAVRKSPADKP